jgi:hypothetical protein
LQTCLIFIVHTLSVYIKTLIGIALAYQTLVIGPRRSFEKECFMKPLKSIVLLTAGALAFGSCSKKQETKTVTPVNDTTMGAGAAPVAEPAVEPAPEPAADHSAAGAAAVGAGAAASKKETPAPEKEEYIEDEGYQDDQLLEEDSSTDIGTGKSTDDYEYVDESASEPDDVRGGRDARMVPKQNRIDNTASEPDKDQM